MKLCYEPDEPVLAALEARGISPREFAMSMGWTEAFTLDVLSGRVELTGALATQMLDALIALKAGFVLVADEEPGSIN
jgi:hypothetical protein